MANLEPMPISSLPEGDIQDGDKMVIYRETTGKAYQTDAGIIEELNADLTDLGLTNKYIGTSNTGNTTSAGTYRIKFGNGTATTGRFSALISMIGYTAQSRAILFYQGYSASNAWVTEIQKGNNITYELDSENAGLIITIGGTSAVAIGLLMLTGNKPTIEAVED